MNQTESMTLASCAIFIIVSLAYCYCKQRSRYIFLSYMTKDIECYGNISAAINIHYASTHGYSFLLVRRTSVTGDISAANDNTSGSDNPQIELYKDDSVTLLDVPLVDKLDVTDERWNKIVLLSSFLQYFANSNHATTDYIVWLDSDLIIIDMDLDLDAYTNAANRAATAIELVISRDSRPEHGMANTGFVAFKVSKWSVALIDKWWSEYNRGSISDQGVFNHMWRKNVDDIRRYTLLLDSNTLNSEFPSYKYHTPLNQVLHLAGEKNDFRAAVFSHAYKALSNSCSTVAEHHTNDCCEIPEQLGLSRTTLQRIRKELCLSIVEEIFYNISMTTAACAVDSVKHNIQKVIQLGYGDPYFRAVIPLNTNSSSSSYSIGNSLLADVLNQEIVDVDDENKVIGFVLEWIYNETAILHHRNSQSIGVSTAAFLTVLQSAIDTAFELLEYYAKIATDSNRHDYDDRIKSIIDDEDAHIDTLIEMSSVHSKAVAYYYRFKLNVYVANRCVDGDYDITTSILAWRNVFPSLIQIDKLSRSPVDPTVLFAALSDDLKDEAAECFSMLAMCLCRKQADTSDSDGIETSGVLLHEGVQAAMMSLYLSHMVWGGADAVVPAHVMPQLQQRRRILVDICGYTA